MTSFKVNALGFEERSRNALSLLLRSLSGGRYELVDGDGADLSIIDFDSYHGRDHWNSVKADFPQRPAVLLSVNEQPSQECHFLRKPFRPAELIAILDDVAKDLVLTLFPSKPGTNRPSQVSRSAASPETKTGQPDTGSVKKTTVSSTPKRNVSTQSSAMKLDDKVSLSFIGSAPDIDLTDCEQVGKVQFDPDRYFLGSLVRAWKLASAHKRPVSLVNALHDTRMTIFPEQSIIVADLDKHRIRALSALPVAKDDIRMELLDSGTRQTTDPKKTVWSIEAFVWLLALWTCRGRVPTSTDLTAKFRLKRWPNMTRLERFPHAMRLAGLWTNRPLSLQEASSSLAIPQRFAFAFYTAASSIGLIESRDAKPVAAVTPIDTAPKKRKRSLFRRILAHLRAA